MITNIAEGEPEENPAASWVFLVAVAPPSEPTQASCALPCRLRTTSIISTFQTEHKAAILQGRPRNRIFASGSRNEIA